MSPDLAGPPTVRRALAAASTGQQGTAQASAEPAQPPGLVIVRPDGVTTFDELRREQSGWEYWSARELRSALGYDTWRHFRTAITRAEQAAQGVKLQVSAHFVDADKMVQTGVSHRAVDDVHLSRFAAYLVALNSDPSKPQVAAAQTYFAVMTRQAELASAAAVPAPTLIATARELALAVLAAEDRADALAGQVAALAPRADVADQLLDADGDVSVGEGANILSRSGWAIGQGRLFALLFDKSWIFRDGKGRPRVHQRALERGLMGSLAQSHVDRTTGLRVIDAPQVRLTPRGLQQLLADHSALRVAGALEERQ